MAIADLLDQQQYPVRIVGYDYSKGMLDEARKNVYHQLEVGDFYGEVPIEEGSADFLICAGVFRDGHVRPDALVKILSHLRKGGKAIITVRITSYEAHTEEYRQYIEKGGGVICDVHNGDYLKPAKGAYITVQKM